MKSYVISILVCFYSAFSLAQTMMFGDTSRLGRPFSKDPHVITFKGKYLMYYSIPPKENSTEVAGWGIGVAESRNLNKWERVGEITPAAPYEAKGLCAPCALVREDTVYLFYQTYGNGKKDAVCHAWSVDGINFVRNATNPVYGIVAVQSMPRLCSAGTNTTCIMQPVLPIIALRSLVWLWPAKELHSTGKRGRTLVTEPYSFLNTRGKVNVWKDLPLYRWVTGCLCSMPELIIMIPNR